MEKIVLVGGGGHCKVIIDIIKSMRKYEIVGITDNKGIGDKILDIPIIGNDEVLSQVYKGGVRNAFVSLGALNNMNLRDEIYYKLRNIGYEIPKLIHNKAVVSPYAKVEDGTCVMAGAVINTGAVIQENCIINTSSVIEHDCFVGRNSHVSPRACIAGGVKIGNNSHIGMGASIIQGINVGSNVVIGAGSVVLNHVKDNVTAVGVPAKIIKCR
ncbi:acetyltransferase [Clostridium ganghwense]|uniref:Acetyltransferase n=1 Tax=Clostridium ganghwense TaxID=312089 RepID=A0ABT4CN69_9CLOT|nr:acetyltransferase [Clostridium ganghwense]MCY6370507.1 acetyltransferase [Clostridium ganghwense]